MNFNYKNEEERNLLKKHFIQNVIDIDKLNKNGKKTILWTIPAETGTGVYRVQTPMLAIAEKYPDKYNLLYLEEENWSLNLLKKIDMWIQHRAGDSHAQYLRMLKAFSIDSRFVLNVHDVDDDEVNLPANHPMRDLWYHHNKDKKAQYQLANVHCISTPSRELRKEFMKYQKVENIKVFRNTFNWNLPQWNLEKPVNEKITIGWAGLTSHLADLTKMSKIMKVIHDKYPNVNFKVAGITDKDEFYEFEKDAEGNLVPRRTNITDEKQTYKYRVHELFKDFESDRIEFLGTLPISEYAKFYTMWDINLVYVEHNKFNKSKSEIKSVEAAFYRSINVLSDFGAYADYVSAMPAPIRQPHLKYCSCRTENISEWVEKISFWVENWDTDMRKNLVEETHNWVKEYYDVFNQVDERIEWLESNYEKFKK